LLYWGYKNFREPAYKLACIAKQAVKDPKFDNEEDIGNNGTASKEESMW
jgi:hypothetical protein